MKIVIIGGHFTPALAVIEALPKNAEVIYFGRKYTFEKDKTVSLEYQTITERNIQFVSITTGRFQRKFSAQTIPSLAKIPYGFFQSLALLKKYKPDLIIGFGGYLSVPVCLAGKVLGIPIVIHEQTLEAGLANRIIAPFATKACISWKSSAKFFPKEKTILTGNPLPPSMFHHTSFFSPKASSIPTICIIGGSTGSHAINLAVEGCLEELLNHYNVIHQTGNAQQFKDYDRLETYKRTLPESLQKRYTIIKYIKPEEFISVLQSADVVISRSGINTVTALLLLKKISVLIPLPYSQRNEQYKNALLVKDAGLGEILEEQSLTPKILFDKTTFVFNNKKTYEKKAAQSKETDSFSAVEKILSVINGFIDNNKKNS